MRAALIGTFNHDVLLQPDGGQVCSPGGLWYSLKALRLLQPEWTILPVAWCPQADREEILARCRELEVDERALCHTTLPGNRVLLDCRREDKPELAELNLPPLGERELAAALDCPVVLLNCTSGRDTSAEAWRAFRRSWRQRHPQGWLQLDWHSLSLDWTPGQPRQTRLVPRPGDWLQGLDLLQCTLAETRSIDGQARASLEDVPTLWPLLLEAGCRRALVSDGPRGMALLDASGLRLQPAWPAPIAADSTGCGDVLGASLLELALGGTDTPEAALRRAAQAAAAVLHDAGLSSLDILRERREA